MHNMEVATPIKELEKAELVIERAKERYDNIRDGVTSYDPVVTARSMLLCKKCGKRSQAKTVQFSRYYWYESPHGCMGGDSWHTDGFMIMCPKCGEWEHAHEPTKSLASLDIQKMEYRIIEKMLRFAQQYGDVHYSNGKYACKEIIEWKHG